MGFAIAFFLRNARNCGYARIENSGCAAAVRSRAQRIVVKRESKIQDAQWGLMCSSCKSEDADEARMCVLLLFITAFITALSRTPWQVWQEFHRSIKR